MATFGIEAKQALRMRRFLMAASAYAVSGALVQASAWLGYLPAWMPMWWVIGVVAANAAFFVLLHSGWNLRLPDPSMTEIQLIVSMVAILVVISQADEARGVLLMFLPGPLLFGVLRLNFRQMARVGIVGLVGYMGVIAVLAFHEPERVRLSLEALYLMSLAAIMFFVCLMGGYISKIRSDLASTVSKIGELAQRDPLTGLFNRRNLMERLDIEIARCDRQMRRGITLCMIDLDHFKRVNDTFGHPVGDEVLIGVGKCLANSIRVIDYVARYGGEEFIILLEADSDDLAFAMCERIRAEVGKLGFAAIQELSINVSIGMASFAKGESSAKLIERADKALYLAKANGRNCVRAAPLS
jgi:diguanylate cyclase (GGDEF)-like protein